jgi:hypothetical protein
MSAFMNASFWGLRASVIPSEREEPFKGLTDNTSPLHSTIPEKTIKASVSGIFFDFTTQL